MPRTGTTLCHLPNWLCQREGFIPRSTPSSQFSSGPLSWRPTHASPPDGQKPRWLQSSIPPTATWLSLNYSEHNHSHVRRHTLPSWSSQLLITPFRLLTHNLSTSLVVQTQTTFSMLQIKHFDYRHLTSSPFLYLLLKLSEGITTLSEETTQRKHAYVTPSSSLNTNKLPSR